MAQKRPEIGKAQKRRESENSWKQLNKKSKNFKDLQIGQSIHFTVKYFFELQWLSRKRIERDNKIIVCFFILKKVLLLNLQNLFDLGLIIESFLG
jgi:hypothetical protein